MNERSVPGVRSGMRALRARVSFKRAQRRCSIASTVRQTLPRQRRPPLRQHRPPVTAAPTPVPTKAPTPVPTHAPTPKPLAQLDDADPFGVATKAKVADNSQMVAATTSDSDDSGDCSRRCAECLFHHGDELPHKKPLSRKDISSLLDSLGAAREQGCVAANIVLRSWCLRMPEGCGPVILRGICRTECDDKGWLGGTNARLTSISEAGGVSSEDVDEATAREPMSTMAVTDSTSTPVLPSTATVPRPTMPKPNESLTVTAIPPSSTTKTTTIGTTKTTTSGTTKTITTGTTKTTTYATTKISPSSQMWSTTTTTTTPAATNKPTTRPASTMAPPPRCGHSDPQGFLSVATGACCPVACNGCDDSKGCARKLPGPNACCATRVAAGGAICSQMQHPPWYVRSHACSKSVRCFV